MLISWPYYGTRFFSMICSCFTCRIVHIFTYICCLNHSSTLILCLFAHLLYMIVPSYNSTLVHYFYRLLVFPPPLWSSPFVLYLLMFSYLNICLDTLIQWFIFCFSTMITLRSMLSTLHTSCSVEHLVSLIMFVLSHVVLLLAPSWI